MKSQGNTILITGAGSGIGRAYAEAFAALGNQVIIAGRNRKALDEVRSVFDGMAAYEVDMARADSIRELARKVVADYPKLNVVFNVAGIMKPENVLQQQAGVDDATATIETNLLGPIRLIAALLPALTKQSSATIVTVSSGLAFVPMAMTPTYCATKAAIHSYSQSLRYQLETTHVEVCEIIPPYVATSLMGEHQANDPNAMPLADFISESMRIMLAEPTPPEINVERVHPLRFAEASGKERYAAFFKQFNDRAADEASASRV